MQKPVLKGALAPASALFLFFMGLETGGFQYSLLKLAGELSLGSAAMGLLPAAQYAALLSGGDDAHAGLPSMRLNSITQTHGF